MKYVYFPVVILLLLLTIMEFVPAAGYLFTHLPKYQYMLYGIAGYMAISYIPFFRRNESWLQTFAHEFAHTLVSLMFLQKIHSFQANERSGMMQHSGKRRFGEMFISLAPYCLPYITYLFLFMRIIGANQMLYVFDILIGFTLTFHLVCFWLQTRPYQTDIQRQGYLRSYLFIAVALIFNLTIILLSIRKGIVDATIYLFKQYWNDIVYLWSCIF